MKRVIFHNKKGLTLVELIAVLVIMTVVIGAACVALYSGAKSTTEGAADYAGHSDAYLLETWLRKNLPTAVGLDVKDHAEKVSDFPGSTEVLNLHFGADGDFIVEKSGAGSVMHVGNMKQIVLKTEVVGSNQELHYELTAENSGRDFILSGGIVLNNVADASSSGAPASSGGSVLIDNTVISPGDTSTYINIAK